jgi:hypothetical protein
MVWLHRTTGQLQENDEKDRRRHVETLNCHAPPEATKRDPTVKRHLFAKGIRGVADPGWPSVACARNNPGTVPTASCSPPPLFFLRTLSGAMTSFFPSPAYRPVVQPFYSLHRISSRVLIYVMDGTACPCPPKTRLLLLLSEASARKRVIVA